jgi:hypothetical protein
MAVIARFSVTMLADKRFELYQMGKNNPSPFLAIGFPKPQVLVSEVGGDEAYLEMNYRFENMTTFAAAWSRIQEQPIRMWRRSLAAYTVPGTARWVVLRVKEDNDEG